MSSELHAVGSGFQTLGFVAALVVLSAMLGYALIVFVMIVLQAVASFGQ